MLVVLSLPVLSKPQLEALSYRFRINGRLKKLRGRAVPLGLGDLRVSRDEAGMEIFSGRPIVFFSLVMNLRWRSIVTS